MGAQGPLNPAGFSGPVGATGATGATIPGYFTGFPPSWWGDGSDGPLTFIPPAVSRNSAIRSNGSLSYTLARSAMFTSLQIPAGVTLTIPSGMTVWVSGFLEVNGTIRSQTNTTLHPLSSTQACPSWPVWSSLTPFTEPVAVANAWTWCLLDNRTCFAGGQGGGNGSGAACPVPAVVSAFRASTLSWFGGGLGWSTTATGGGVYTLEGGSVGGPGSTQVGGMGGGVIRIVTPILRGTGTLDVRGTTALPEPGPAPSNGAGGGGGGLILLALKGHAPTSLNYQTQGGAGGLGFSTGVDGVKGQDGDRWVHSWTM